MKDAITIFSDAMGFVNVQNAVILTYKYPSSPTARAAAQ